MSSTTLSPLDPQFAGNTLWYISLIGSATSATAFNMSISVSPPTPPLSLDIDRTPPNRFTPPFYASSAAQYFVPPTPAPTPGFSTALNLNTPVTFVGLAATMPIFYTISMDPALVSTLGFRINLQPTATTDADLYFSTIPPSGTTFVTQVASELGTGVLDFVIIAPTSPYWLTSGGTYYIMVKGFSATPSTYALTVLPVPVSPSPAPWLPTPAPNPHYGVGQLSLTSAPGTQQTLAPGSRACYMARGDPTLGQLTATLTAIDNTTVGTWASGNYGTPIGLTPTANLVLNIYSSWPPETAPLISGSGDTTAPVPSRTVRVLDTDPWWLGFSGQYFLCVSAPGPDTNIRPIVFRLSLVAQAVQPSASPQPPVVTSLPADTPVTGTIPWAGGWAFFNFSSPAPTGNVILRVNPQGAANSVVLSTFSTTGAESWVPRFSARIDTGSLILTGGSQQKAYAWVSNARRILPDLQFSFDFRVASVAGGHGDGMCFVVQNDPLGMNAEGGVGDALGLAGDGTVVGIRNSISVCVDTVNNGNGLAFSTYVSLNGNMTCGRVSRDYTGCAYALPDLSANSPTYTMSVDVDGTDNLVWWDITNTNSGVTLGSWQTMVPNIQGVLGGSQFGWVGFSAATSAGADIFSVTDYYWGTRDRVLNAGTGGDSAIYVGLSRPTSRDFFSSYEIHSDGPGGDAVTITPIVPYWSQPSGTYYVGIYCNGPAGCAFTVEGHVGASFASPTPSPNYVTPSNSRTPTPSPNPANLLQALTFSPLTGGASATAVVTARSSNYYSFTVPPTSLVYGAITFYVTGLPPVQGTNSTPNFNLEVGRAAPRCTGAYVNASDGAGVSCAFTPDLVANNPNAGATDSITLQPGSLDYPDQGGVLYVRVYNAALLVPNEANTGAFTLRVAMPDNGPGAGAPDGSSTLIIGIVVGVLVVVAVLGALGFATIVMGKKYGSRAQVMVMTTALPQQEDAPAAYGAPSSAAAAGASSSAGGGEGGASASRRSSVNKSLNPLAGAGGNGAGTYNGRAAFNPSLTGGTPGGSTKRLMDYQDDE